MTIQNDNNKKSDLDILTVHKVLSQCIKLKTSCVEKCVKGFEERNLVYAHTTWF